MVVLPITGASNLIIARLITDAGSSELFGVVMLIVTLGELLIFADLGAGGAVASARAQVQDTPDAVEEYQRTMLTAFRTTLCSAGLITGAAIVLWGTGAWPDLLGVHDGRLGAGLNIAAALTLFLFAAGLPFTLGGHILRGAGRMHQAVLIAGVAAPTALAATGVLYLLGAPTLAYVLPIPFGAFVSAVCGTVQMRRTDWAIVRGIVGKILLVREFPGRPIAATAAPWFIVMIGLPIALQSDRVIISHRNDLASLSDYSYLAQLYAPLWSVISLAALALWPNFAAHNTTRHDIRKCWLTGLVILGSAGVVGALCFVVLSPYIVGWTSGGSAHPSWSLLMAFAALLVVQSVHVTTGIMLISPSQLRFQAVCVILLVLVNLPLSWFLAPKLGAAGPVLASVITVTVIQLIPAVVMAIRVTSDKPDDRFVLSKEVTHG